MEKLEKVKVYDGHKSTGPVWTLRRTAAHVWDIEGKEVLLKAGLINTHTDEGVTQLIRYIDGLGIEEELAKQGAKTGDEVHVGDFVFEYSE
jgi:Obg family GTPase CgtA-like protein